MRDTSSYSVLTNGDLEAVCASSRDTWGAAFMQHAGPRDNTPWRRERLVSRCTRYDLLALVQQHYAFPLYLERFDETQTDRLDTLYGIAPQAYPPGQRPTDYAALYIEIGSRMLQEDACFFVYREPGEEVAPEASQLVCQEMPWSSVVALWKFKAHQLEESRNRFVQWCQEHPEAYENYPQIQQPRYEPIVHLPIASRALIRIIRDDHAAGV